MNFNKEQLEVINHKDGACVVIAGAGSGKTTVLHGRINNLVNNLGVEQEDILAISFTTNTASELKKKLQTSGLSNVKTGTFHAICREILKNMGYINIHNKLKDWDIEKCFKKVIGKDKINSGDISSFISYQKNNMVGINDDFVDKESKYSECELRKCYKEYEVLKKNNNCYDFDDQLLLCYDELKKNPKKYTWKYILIDEHQDNNLIQNLLIQEWSENENIMVVGDFRQSIYAFRAARPELFMHFNKQFKECKVINLLINYRSCENIVDYSNSFIKNYYGDYEFYKDSMSNNKEDGIIDYEVFNNSKDESLEIVDRIKYLTSTGVNLKNIAILYRNNSHSDAIQCELKKDNIPYKIDENNLFFKRSEINGIISILKLINNITDNHAFETIFSKFRVDLIKFFRTDEIESVKSMAAKRNISYFESLRSYNFDKPWKMKNAGEFVSSIFDFKLQRDKNIDLSTLIDNVVTAFNIKDYIELNYETDEERQDRYNSIENLKKFIKNNDLNSFLRYIETPMQTNSNKDAVNLMTIHKSKGLEFDYVFIVGIEDGKFPSCKTDIKEEARLMYVAVTRPKKYICLSSIGNSSFVYEYINGNNQNIDKVSGF